jgi:hypothetical protein
VAKHLEQEEHLGDLACQQAGEAFLVVDQRAFHQEEAVADCQVV